MVWGIQISTASQGASGTAFGPLTSEFWLRYTVILADGACRAKTQLKSFMTYKSSPTPKDVELACTDYLKLVYSFSIK